MRQRSCISAFPPSRIRAFLHSCVFAFLHFCIRALLHFRFRAFVHPCFSASGALVCACLTVTLLPTRALAQPAAVSRLSVLVAEDRRAATAADLATLRAGTRSRDPLTARIAIRALGRLERPALVSDLVPALGSVQPESRAEAANAIAQAAQGWARSGESNAPAGTPGPSSALSALAARLEAEQEASVRAAICESIGRLPYSSADQVAVAETALIDQAGRSDSVTDRLGVAKGFEALVRVSRTLRPPSPRAVDLVKKLFAPTPAAASGQIAPGGDPARRPRLEADPMRDARVRRLALETLIAADATDDNVVARAMADPDPQVRRLAMRAASASGRDIDVLARGLEDAVPMVRIEALRGMRVRTGEQACGAALTALADPATQVALVALDQLASCGSWTEAVTRLEGTANDLSTAGMPRGWHRAAHAVVALASAAPDRASAALGQFTGSSVWQLRMYAARAAALLGDRDRLEILAKDPDDNVVEAAIDGLVKVSGHASDVVYMAALSRSGYQAIRAAALALDGSPDPGAAVPALKTALQRLVAEGHANSLDTRAALVATLTNLGSSPPSRPSRTSAAPTPTPGILNAEDLRRLVAPRARITIAGVGTFELALFPSEATVTVLQFVDLARSDYYGGLTFHRVVPNFVVQGGSPGANEYVGYPSQMRDEVGLWPHVRGAVGISTRGRDTGDAQIFIDLVDNPRLDHQYTVFGQVLNGIEVIDRILEGDVIEKIEILR
jgi:cyclophilin family peptidyl-prolyl cis-trans isomerase